MEFDISKFAKEFKNTIDWMLKDKHSKEIKDDLQLFKNNKSELSNNQDSTKALRTLVELIITQAWYYRKPSSFDSEIDSFITKYGISFRTPTAQKDLVELVGKLAPPKIVTQAKKNLQKLLTEYPTIKRFTDKLYVLAKDGKPNEVLGEKGRDNYLRDFGYWDRIPMDRHEMRFIIRTGIYHACSERDKNDPLEKGSLHDALTRFCSMHLKGEEMEGIDLGNAPGIVDIFIWSYCGKGRYNICGSTSKCDGCNLRGVCLYALTKSP
jgi:hypothetical protein